ncbi:MAG: glycosyltransferase, partial [Longimicrobiales bacterium]
MITATDPAPARETTAAPGATRLWVVSELYYPEQTSTGYFVTRIAEGLARDYEVHALCSQPTYSARGIVAASRERRNGVMVQRCRSTRLDKNIRPFRLLNLVTFTTAVFATALRRFRAGDMALVVTNPPLIPYAMFAACRLKRARLVLLVHDVYPEVLVATGVAEANSRLVRWWHRASRKLYRGADRIVVLGRDMK